MVAITTSFANNITTSGVFKASAFNNSSFDNVTSVAEGAVESGNMKLLTTSTFTNQSSVAFTSGIDSTYKEYQFYIVNIDVDTNGAALTWQASTDGGSNYGVTVTNSYSQNYINEAGTTGGSFGYVTVRDLAQSTAEIKLNDGINNDADSSSVGVVKLFNPSSTTYIKHYIAENTTMWDLPGPMTAYTAGYFNTTNAINAVRFKASGGNITGTILMYGIL